MTDRLKLVRILVSKCNLYMDTSA